MAKLTELVFILDKSGSMCGMEKDTIGGFNSFIEKSKKEDTKTLLTTFLFSNSYTIIHDRIDVNKVEPLTEKDYWTSGCTALLDTIGYAICHIEKIHRYARKADRPDKTIFVITTDGMENASREYSYSLIKEMIKSKQDSEKWEFLFLADNIDAAENADRIGIRRSHAANYSVKHDTGVMYDTIYKVAYCATPLCYEKDLQDMIDEEKKHRKLSTSKRKFREKN